MKKILMLTCALSFAFAAQVRPVDIQILNSDPACEQACFDDYLQCASGCAACDQCSCQLALCRAGCGVPFTGC